MPWTLEQSKAISLSDHNILVSASAGSGKTAVLVERILELSIRERLAINKFLIVTFTNAAAQEMRERIARRLVEYKKESPKDRFFINEQIQLIQQANISTLHSFCKEVIKRNFYQLDLDPNFKVATQQTLELKKNEALDHAFEKAYEAQDEGFHRLLNMYSSHKNDNGLKMLVTRVYTFSRAHPYPDKWLGACLSNYKPSDDNYDQSPLMLLMIQSIIITLKQLQQQLLSAYELCLEPGGPTAYAETLMSDLDAFDHLLDNSLALTYPLIEKRIREFSFIKLKTIKKAEKDSVDAELAERIKAVRNGVKKDFDKLLKDYFFAPFERCLLDLEAMYLPLQALVNLVQSFSQIYQQLKKDDNLLDFNDLEQFAIKALQNSEVAQSYIEQFDYLFVDEYQDSNTVQEEIIRLIKRENNLFLVGDVKQSIYRFRMAEPGLFLDKFHSYPSLSHCERVDLNQNFRTHPDVLRGVNLVFNDLMTEGFGGLSYQKDGQLIPGREDFQGSAKPHITLAFSQSVVLNEESVTDDGQDELDLSALELEAKAIIHRIGELLRMEFYDTHLKVQRMFQLSDMVILLRSVKGNAQKFRDTLSHAGFPVAIDEEDSYFEMIEVVTIINCLRVIDNIRQDIPLLGVLRSPIGGLTDSELATVRSYGSESFYDALLTFYSFGKPNVSGEIRLQASELELWLKVDGFLVLLEKLRGLKYLSASEFLGQLLETTGYGYFVSGLEDGAFRRQHLDVLIEKAEQFDAQNQSGLHHFVAYLDQLQQAKVAYGGKANEKSGINAIKILSIHKSKGLEFPVVFLAGLGKRFNLMDLRDRLILHQDVGLSTKWIDDSLRVQRDTLPYNHVKRMLRQETVAEEARILYVAMTRAIYRLELVYSCKDLEKKLAHWLMPVTSYSLSQKNCFADWIMTILVQSKEVPTTEAHWQEHFNCVKEMGNSCWSYSAFSSTVETSVAEKEQTSAAFEALYESLTQGEAIWREPPVVSTSLPAKISVTELKNQAEQEDYLPKVSRFTSDFEDSSKALERGNAYHLILEHLPLEGDTLNEKIALLSLTNAITEEQFKLIDLAKLESFVRSQWYTRIQQARRVWREKPFVFNKTLNEQESILVQGIIDLLFLESDGLVLVDYKSDQLLSQGDFKERYQVQLGLYKEACEALLNIPVKQVLIYAIRLEEWIEIDFAS